MALGGAAAALDFDQTQKSCGPEVAEAAFAVSAERGTSHWASSGLASVHTCCSWLRNAARVSGERSPRTQSLSQTAWIAAAVQTVL